MCVFTLNSTVQTTYNTYTILHQHTRTAREPVESNHTCRQHGARKGGGGERDDRQGYVLMMRTNSHGDMEGVALQYNIDSDISYAVMGCSGGGKRKDLLKREGETSSVELHPHLTTRVAT